MFVHTGIGVPVQSRLPNVNLTQQQQNKSRTSGLVNSFGSWFGNNPTGGAPLRGPSSMAATAAGRSGRGAKLPVVPGTVPANATAGGGGLFSGMFNRGQWIQYMRIKIQSTESSSA